jgi:hypothetical protein
MKKLISVLLAAAMTVSALSVNAFAEETGWWFPSSQSITNYSNVVCVSAS